VTSLRVICTSDNLLIYCVFSISDFFIFIDCTLHSSRKAWSCSYWWVLKDDMQPSFEQVKIPSFCWFSDCTVDRTRAWKPIISFGFSM
jgi:hypothetical protein